jgi:hypothetical protein
MDKRKPCCIAAVFPAVLLLTAATGSAQSFVAPPESLPGGLSYQQWSAKWWQWVWSTPISINPLFDTTGIDCAVNQSKTGPVWFLAGTSGTDATRNCIVPAGRMIFFPIINLGNDYPCLDLSPTPPRQRRDPNFQPGPGQSLEQFLTIGYGSFFGARQYIDHVTSVNAMLDGVPIQDLSLPPENSKYRATSPMFEFDGDRSLLVWDSCVGPGHHAVSDGYWIMLKPLSLGFHTLTFSGTETYPSSSFTVTVTYNLTIV